MGKYTPKTLEQKFGWAIEECGELCAAIGKTQRWGLDSVNPELPEEEQETNGDWVLREISDVKKAIALLEEELLRVHQRPIQGPRG